ncbi:MAG TPA: lysine-2,3-aminomutase-like protein [Stellaceae bacterium]|nr:lysine-2,3-aminomutase-like protein [Stellaceae bacterium]
MAGRSLRRIRDLTARGLLPEARAAALERVTEHYAVAITPAIAELIDPADPADPIARQFVPDLAELVVTPEERADPIGDERFSPVKGIVHRYPDRVLLKPLHACPVYCRFCFRREQVGPEGDVLTRAELDAALDYIRTRPEIWEVIVTGGDPFLLSPRRLAGIVRVLDEIEHVQVIRFHTRVPVVDPAGVTARLIAALGAQTAVYVAIHANHPRELTPAFRTACRRLVRAGIPLIGQTVLLRGVNDDAAVLERLFRGLVAARVKPYYLHHPDLARGTDHFRVDLRHGQALMRRLRGRVSGLCQPSYVLDLPGGLGKVPVGPCYAGAEKGGRHWAVEDIHSGRHRYPPANGSG